MCLSWCSCGHRLGQDMARSEWEPGGPCQGLGKWSPQKMCVERKALSFHAMVLDVTDPLDFRRLISVGNPSKMINVFWWSTLTCLVSSAWVKISEVCSICKDISVISMHSSPWHHTLQALAVVTLVGVFIPVFTEGEGADASSHLLSWSVWLHSRGPKILSLNHCSNSAQGPKCLMKTCLDVRKTKVVCG